MRFILFLLFSLILGLKVEPCCKNYYFNRSPQTYNDSQALQEAVAEHGTEQIYPLPEKFYWTDYSKCYQREGRIICDGPGRIPYGTGVSMSDWKKIN